MWIWMNWPHTASRLPVTGMMGMGGNHAQESAEKFHLISAMFCLVDFFSSARFVPLTSAQGAQKIQDPWKLGHPRRKMLMQEGWDNGTIIYKERNRLDRSYPTQTAHVLNYKGSTKPSQIANLESVANRQSLSSVSELLNWPSQSAGICDFV